MISFVLPHASLQLQPLKEYDVSLSYSLKVQVSGAPPTFTNQFL